MCRFPPLKNVIEPYGFIEELSLTRVIIAGTRCFAFKLKLISCFIYFNKLHDSMSTLSEGATEAEAAITFHTLVPYWRN